MAYNNILCFSMFYIRRNSAYFMGGEYTDASTGAATTHLNVTYKTKKAKPKTCVPVLKFRS